MTGDKIRLRSCASEAEREEAYQSWLSEGDAGTRFRIVGQGPLMIDTKTFVVYDAVEFLIEREDRKGALTR